MFTLFNNRYDDDEAHIDFIEGGPMVPPTPERARVVQLSCLIDDVLQGQTPVSCLEGCLVSWSGDVQTAVSATSGEGALAAYHAAYCYAADGLSRMLDTCQNGMAEEVLLQGLAAIEAAAAEVEALLGNA